MIVDIISLYLGLVDKTLRPFLRATLRVSLAPAKAVLPTSCFALTPWQTSMQPGTAFESSQWFKLTAETSQWRKTKGTCFHAASS
jgi:hypothetical protein